jgi:ABC-type cobalamin transport system ATPase subunit
MVQLDDVRPALPGADCPAASSSVWHWPAPWCSNRKLVLMDEPLGALDKQLREHMQMEIKHLHKRLGVTVVYVTHDQGEALDHV